MSGNSFGKFFKITTFGESHGKAVGVVIDGCPSNLELSEKDIQPELDRRRPGQSKITTTRDEKDQVEILSGIYQGKTTGSPISLIVYSKDQRSQDYDKIKEVFRPSHADFTFQKKYGHRDPRGGGRTSARIMIARVAAGAIAKKYLKQKLGLECLAYTQQIGDIRLPEANYNLKDFCLESERLILKPISFEYLEEIYKNFTEKITQYLVIDILPPKHISETAEFIASAISKHTQGSELTFVVTTKDKNEFVGLTSLQNANSKEISFGLWVKEKAQNKGYASEFLKTTKKFAEKNLNPEKFVYRVEKRNLASQKLAKKLKGKLIQEYSEIGKNTGRKFNWMIFDLPIESESNKELKNKKPLYEKVTLEQIESNIVRCPDQKIAQKMIRLIESIKKEQDSIGGVIQGVIRKVPIGLGEPEFDKLPAVLAKAMMSINAVKGFEIGSGFAGSKMKGSQHNDLFIKNQQGKIITKTNHAGGVLGGVSNGNSIHFKVAIKPVATISKTQETIDKNGNKTKIEGKGRHDPCVLPRAVPIVEAMSALVMMDLYLANLSR